MQPETRGSRADAIFEWNRSTAGGGGGKTEQSGRAQGPSAWCEAKIQGTEQKEKKKNSLQGAGAAAACCCYERGVDIAWAHEMEERDRWWWLCWRREKNKKRIGVHAFSAVLQLHRRRFKGASVFCLAVVKKKKKNQSQWACLNVRGYLKIKVRHSSTLQSIVEAVCVLNWRWKLSQIFFLPPEVIRCCRVELSGVLQYMIKHVIICLCSVVLVMHRSSDCETQNYLSSKGSG